MYHNMYVPLYAILYVLFVQSCMCTVSLSVWCVCVCVRARTGVCVFGGGEFSQHYQSAPPRGDPWAVTIYTLWVN